MPHRFRPHTALGLFLAVAAVVSVSAVSAIAAEAPVTRPVPGDAPTVATTPSGAAIIAWVVGGRTCTVLQEAGAARPTTMRGNSDGDGPAPNGSCVTTPVLSQFNAEPLRSVLTTSRHGVAWGVAGPGSARLELREGSKVLASSPAAPAPLPGPAAGLRFWAIETQLDDATLPDEVALLDATGTVRRAWSPLLLWIIVRSPLSLWSDRDGILLQRGRFGDSKWQLRRIVTQRLSPTPVQPERRVELHCLRFMLRDPQGNGVGDGGPCDDDLRTITPLIVEQGSSCAGIYVLVVARASVRSAVVTLGDGSRRTVALHALGGALGAVGGVVVVEPGMAIRHLEGRDAAGKLLRRWPLGEPPVPVHAKCSASSSTSLFADDFFGQSETLAAHAHVAQAFDRDDELCVAVDRAPRVPRDCGVPPLDPESSFLGLFRTTSGTFLYGIVSAEVVAARVTFADGTTQVVPASAIPGYAGRYAGTVAQIALDVPVGRTPRSSVLLDADGRVVSARQGLGTFPTPHIGRPVTLRPARDGLKALLATPISIGSGDGYTCVSLGPPPSNALACDFGADEATGGASTVQVLAHCDPRRTIVRGVLRRSTDHLVVRTRSGHEVMAESFRIPDRAGAGAGRYVALAVLGPHEAIAGIRVRGKAARRLHAVYPPAADQCGYSDQPSGSLFS